VVGGCQWVITCGTQAMSSTHRKCTPMFCEGCEEVLRTIMEAACAAYQVSAMSLSRARVDCSSSAILQTQMNNDQAHSHCRMGR
jgi:hypothetical protein